ncbi:MAG TPA: endonuclease VII domain-containing protein [Candidatus Baltobacteraceae bacterium]|nr:endonuclease VII domain-containing protein [Candidatus Baltobacteraceae bacterium]
MSRRRTASCSKCGAQKIILPSGASRCIPCHNRWGKEYYHASARRRENQRRTYVFRKYGLSIEGLEQLLRRQDERCAICRKPWQECVRAKPSRYEALFLHHLCVDHDHATGMVRGLLCNACNIAIGMLEEEPGRFHAAIAYLEQNKG